MIVVRARPTIGGYHRVMPRNRSLLSFRQSIRPGEPLAVCNTAWSAAGLLAGGIGQVRVSLPARTADLGWWKKKKNLRLDSGQKIHLLAH